MKIILEKVQKGVNFTGVAQIMNGEINVNNVSFTVNTVVELENFITNLLRVQTEFASVTEGEYTPTVKVESVKTVEELALQAIYQLKEKINLGIIKETDQEFIDAVTAYKVATSTK